MAIKVDQKYIIICTFCGTIDFFNSRRSALLRMLNHVENVRFNGRQHPVEVQLIDKSVIFSGRRSILEGFVYKGFTAEDDEVYREYIVNKVKIMLSRPIPILE